MKLATLGSIIVLLFIVSPLPVHAQYGGGGNSEGTVSGTGTITLERLPDTMRLQVSVLAKAGTLKEALDALKKRVETAKAQLVEFGAAKESIEVGTPKLGSAKTQQQQQMEQMMRQRMKRGGRKLPAAAAKTPIVVTVDLKADWKLTAKTAEELLLATHPLQEKIKTADIAGAAEAAKLSEEEQEAQDEAESQYGGYSSDNEPKPGDPMFYFVAKFSDAEIDKALAEAFQKAKADAERTCKASGLKLGPISSLSNNNTNDIGYDSESYGYSNYASNIYRRLQSQRRSSSDSTEATGVQPENVSYAVNVHAAFRILPE